MGLDASVRCRCFEDGKLKAGPVPVEDLYIDEEGYLSSRKLDEAYERYDWRRFLARYEQLRSDFDKWLAAPCEHEDGEACCEWVGNWAGCAEFRDLVEDAGGKSEFPLLSELLPHANGGIYPAEKAQATLEELERFIERVCEIEQWVLCDCEAGGEIWASTDQGSFTWCYGPFERAGMIGGKVFFEYDGYPRLETSHFKQIPAGEPRANGDQRMRILCLDTGAWSRISDSLGPEDGPKTEREFRVVRKEAPFLYEGKYWMAERLRNLLVASIDTGNPIRWC